MAADPHVTEKVQAALVQTGGDRRAAQRLLLAWAMEDGRLMRALVLPFLPGIIGRAIDQTAPGTASRAAVAPAAKTPAPPSPSGRTDSPSRPKAPVTGDLLDQLADRLGERFDRSEPSPSAENGEVGQAREAGAARQASSLRTLAVAHARRRYDPDRPAD